LCSGGLSDNNQGVKAPCFNRLRSLALLCWTISAIGLQSRAQTPAALDIQLYSGLNITGSIGTVYSIEFATHLAQTNSWQCLEFLQLPVSPYLWIDKSAPATGRRFYRAVTYTAPTNMIFISPGKFRMGSPNNEVDRSSDEGPQTDVTISSGFWMAIYPVTQANYLALMGTNPSWFSTNFGFTQDLSRPVEQVSWFDATDYCGMLTLQDQKAGRIPLSSAYRLPTEAEWEYACRAGTSTRFSYGDDPGYLSLTNYAWYTDNSGAMTHPVRQKLPNPWGLYDMAGNVLEWCADWYGPYPGGVVLDPLGPPAGLTRVLRVSHWSNYADRCRSAHRAGNYPDQASSFTGLRVVLGPSRP